MKLLQSLKCELKKCHVRHVTHVTGKMEKFKMTLTICFVQNGKKNNDKALISIKMLPFLETIMASCTNVTAIRVSFCLWQRRLSGSLVFTLKKPRSVFGHCVMQNTKYSLKIYSGWKKEKKKKKKKTRGLSKSAPPSDVLQQLK